MLHSLLVRIPVPQGAAVYVFVAIGILILLLTIVALIKNRRQTWAKAGLIMAAAIPTAVGGLFFYSQHRSAARYRDRKTSAYDDTVKAAASEAVGLADAMINTRLKEACARAMGTETYSFSAYLVPLKDDLRRRYKLQSQTEPVGADHHSLDRGAVWKVNRHAYADGEELPNLQGVTMVVVAAVKDIVTASATSQAYADMVVRVFDRFGPGGKPKGRVCEGTARVGLTAEQLATGGTPLLAALAAGALQPVCSSASGSLCYAVNKRANELAPPRPTAKEAR